MNPVIPVASHLDTGVLAFLCLKTTWFPSSYCTMRTDPY